jgi:hypothetical protein
VGWLIGKRDTKASYVVRWIHALQKKKMVWLCILLYLASSVINFYIACYWGENRNIAVFHWLPWMAKQALDLEFLSPGSGFPILFVLLFKVF